MATTHSSQLLSNKARIIDALLLRELMARFGHNNVGFLWQIIEPLMLMVGVMVAWSLIYGERNHGVMVLPLVLTGYSVLTLWRHMTGRLPNTFRDASGLLFHRDVKPADILVARGILESISTLVAFFIALLPLQLIGIMEPVHDYLVLLGAWSLMCLFSFGSALIITALAHFSEAFERFVQPVMYIILPLTGVLLHGVLAAARGPEDRALLAAGPHFRDDPRRLFRPRCPDDVGPGVCRFLDHRGQCGGMGAGAQGTAAHRAGVIGQP